MSETDLRVKAKRKRQNTTNSEHDFQRNANLVQDMAKVTHRDTADNLVSELLFRGYQASHKEVFGVAAPGHWTIRVNR